MGDRKKNQADNPSGNYKLSRLNATRHGILSQHTLLPWEPQEEYGDLHLSLRQEYAPMGITEEHLVEEIAGIIWRKRRLRLAETSVFRKRYSKLVTDSSSLVAESGLLGKERLRIPIPEGSPWPEEHWVEPILSMNPEETPRLLKSCLEDIKFINRALEILKAKSPDAYRLASEAMGADRLAPWKMVMADKSVKPSAEDLQGYLEGLLDVHRKRFVVLSNLSMIMEQAHGESHDPENLDKLSRYEVFLDRKLERILSMLLKLQALRREKEERVIE
jgi:hypothetical protein